MISREFRRLAATEIWKVSQRSLQICIPLLRIGRKQRGKNHWKENYRVKAEVVFNSKVSVSRNQQCESSNSMLNEILACQRQNLPFIGAPGTDHEKTFLQTFFQRREGILKSDFEITKEEARHAYLGALVSNAAGMILAKNGASFVTQRFKTLSKFLK